MDEEPCYNVGLGGDGDEVAAIEDVEEEFGVTLDDRDAPQWLTAGDVFASLLKVLPSNASTDPATWERFAEALSGQTGIDPSLITKSSPLLLPDKGFWGGFKEIWSGCVLVWAALLLALFIFG